MKKFNLVASIALSLIITGFSNQLIAKSNFQSAHGYSQHQQHNKTELNAKRIMRHLSLLDLTEQQRVEIEIVVENAVQAVKPKQQEIALLHTQLKQIKRSGKVDEQAIRTLASEIASLKADLFIMHLNKRKEVSELLTQEQLARFERIKAARKNDF